MNDSHLRRLAVTVRALEDALVEVEAALSPMPDRLMTIYQGDIPQPARLEIRQRIESLRQQIHAVKERYSLDAEAISNRRRILAKLSVLSIDLTEATSRYMRAYGEVPAEDQASLDQQITSMISLVNEMIKLVV